MDHQDLGLTHQQLRENLAREIQANYHRVVEQIEESATLVGRDPSTVRLVVVTKSHPLESILAAMDAGIRIFGENYTDEAVAKILAIGGEGDPKGQPGQDLRPSAGLEWHMIGHVQSRKAALVVEHFDWLHSLDSLKLAERLNRFAGQSNRRLPVLLECNVSGEESKFGWPAWQEDHWSDLDRDFEALLDLPSLEVHGLMTMAPFFDEPEPARPFFQRLRRLRDYLATRFPQADWRELSMGMSGDFCVAVQEHATILRVGTAIMGARNQLT